MTRYAVYALPGALGDADDPAAVQLRDTVEAWYARAPFRDLTVDARRYGFHGTLKAPFRLADDRSEADLRAAADDFAAAHEPVPLSGLRVERLGGFRALLLRGDETGIRALADDAVRSFDGFRAAPDAANLRRRRPEELPPRQRELFEQWGYPFVLDEFRFHLTLTDPVPPEHDTTVDDALAEHFADAPAEVRLRSIALFIEPSPGAPFRVLSVHPLTAARSDTDSETDRQETV